MFFDGMGSSKVIEIFSQVKHINIDTIYFCPVVTQPLLWYTTNGTKETGRKAIRQEKVQA